MWVDNLADIGITKLDPKYRLLTGKGALSTALREKCNMLSVQLIKQEMCRAAADEQQILHISENNSFIREVYLVGDGKPLVQARVVAPFTTYVQFKKILDNLGNKFIGETLIYKQPYTRTAFQYSKIDNILKRRSIFLLQNYPILIQEIFL